jgi:preprotein translocase subunit SecE
MSWTTRLREFVKEVRVESTKVSWPSRIELRDSTVVVIVAVLLVSGFVGIVDQILARAVTLLFR